MPKILDARIRLWVGYANTPELELLVDEIPDFRGLTWENRGPVYYVEHPEGWAQWLWKRDRTTPEQGFGGALYRFKVNDKDRVREVELRGPWSGSDIACNVAGFGPVMQVILFPKSWGQYRTSKSFVSQKEECLNCGHHSMEHFETMHGSWDEPPDVTQVPCAACGCEDFDEAEPVYEDKVVWVPTTGYGAYGIRVDVLEHTLKTQLPWIKVIPAPAYAPVEGMDAIQSSVVRHGLHPEMAKSWRPKFDCEVLAPDPYKG
jgi:hypothetical protein